MDSTLKSLPGVRFLCLVAHSVVLLTTLIDHEEMILSSLPIEYSQSEFDSINIQLVVCCSLSLGFLLIEVIGLVSGITMFAPLTSLYSCFSHGLAAVCLSFALTDLWPAPLHWIVFGALSVPPLLFELVAIVSVFLKKNL